MNVSEFLDITGSVFRASSAPGKVAAPPVSVYSWNVAHGPVAPPTVKGTREAIEGIPGAMVDYDTAEKIEQSLLDADGFYRR